MKKEADYRRGLEIVKFAIVVIIFIVVVSLVYYLSVYKVRCGDKTCFNDHLVKCKKARWINNAEDAIWSYEIKGRTKEGCEVDVRLKSVKEGKTDLTRAEGKEMTCFVPGNTIETPGSNLEVCTGRLKEEMQDLIIKRMHSYILENLGTISEEITSPL